MVKKTQNLYFSNRLENKEEFEYKVTARLICGECGKDIDKKTRDFSGDFELDLNADSVQEFFLKEMVNGFDYEEKFGDFVIVEVYDCQKKDLQIFDYVCEDDEAEDDSEDNCCCGR